MASERRRKETTTAKLPEELLRREILTRLPIKSVVRFKSVSKAWLSLFSTPQFVNQHFTYNSTKNPKDSDLLIAEKQPSNLVLLSRYNETSLLLPPCILLGSIRGVVCLFGRKFSLWNPALNQSKEFSYPPHSSDGPLGHFGFGFDSVNNNFKLVDWSYDFKSASVYYSNYDRWIDVTVPENVYVYLEFLIGTPSSVTVVKDCPYWTFRRSANLIVVKFDAQSDDLKLFHFNPSEHNASLDYDFTFVDLNECLTLIKYDQYSSECMLDIFSLDGEEGGGVWSKMYSIGPLDFSRPDWIVSQGFYDGEIVFRELGRFFSYDLKTGTIMRFSTIKRLGKIFKDVSVLNCFRYTPSLAFIEGMKSVFLPTQTRHSTDRCSRVPRRLFNSLRS